MKLETDISEVEKAFIGVISNNEASIKELEENLLKIVSKLFGDVTLVKYSSQTVDPVGYLEAVKTRWRQLNCDLEHRRQLGGSVLHIVRAFLSRLAELCRFGLKRGQIPIERAVLEKHFSLWRIAEENPKVNWFLFSEADSIFHHSSHRRLRFILEFCSKFPKSDPLYIDLAGGNILPSFYTSTCEEVTYKSKIIRLYSGIVTNTACTYMLNRAALTRMNEILSMNYGDIKFLPIDFALNHIGRSIKSVKSIHCEELPFSHGSILHGGSWRDEG